MVDPKTCEGCGYEYERGRLNYGLCRTCDYVARRWIERLGLLDEGDEPEGLTQMMLVYAPWDERVRRLMRYIVTRKRRNR